MSLKHLKIESNGDFLEGFEQLRLGNGSEDLGVFLPWRLKTQLIEEKETAKQKSIEAFFEAQQEISNQALETCAELDTDNPEEESLPVVVEKKATRTKSRLIKVFDVEQVENGNARAKRGDSDHRKRILHSLEKAGENDGFRTIPSFKHMPKQMLELTKQFPNFKSIIQGVSEELALNAAASPSDFRVAPLLLDGVPGIGKTAFSLALAESLDVPFYKLGAAGLQHAGQIVGLASSWGNTTTGAIFDLLSKSKSAVAVLLIDEVDKIPRSTEHPVIPALLELLEPASARLFKDESLGLVFDASRLIVLMTSNDKRAIDPALVSRANVFDIQEPDANQRFDIAQGIHNALCKSTKKKLTLDTAAVREMAESKIDLRLVHRSVRSAFAQALLEKSAMVKPTLDGVQFKRRIGF